MKTIRDIGLADLVKIGLFALVVLMGLGRALADEPPSLDAAAGQLAEKTLQDGKTYADGQDAAVKAELKAKLGEIETQWTGIIETLQARVGQQQADIKALQAKLAGDGGTGDIDPLVQLDVDLPTNWQDAIAWDVAQPIGFKAQGLDTLTTFLWWHEEATNTPQVEDLDQVQAFTAERLSGLDPGVYEVKVIGTAGSQTLRAQGWIKIKGEASGDAGSQVDPPAGDAAVHPGDDIQAAINRLGDGDTLTINAGTYDIDTIELRKNVSLVGVGMPTIRTTGDGIYVAGADDLVISGLHLINKPRAAYKPDTKSWNAGGIVLRNESSNVTIEDCTIEYYKFNIVVEATGGDDKRHRNITIKGNRILNAYGHWDGNIAGHSSGLYAHKVVGLDIIGNVFDHNGWCEKVSGAGATKFNHNVYIQKGANTLGINVRGNLFARASSHGLQLRPGGSMVGNLFWQNAYGAFTAQTPDDKRCEMIGNVLFDCITDRFDKNSGGNGLQVLPADPSGTGRVYVQDNIVWGQSPGGSAGPAMQFFSWSNSEGKGVPTYANVTGNYAGGFLSDQFNWGVDTVRSDNVELVKAPGYKPDFEKLISESLKGTMPDVAGEIAKVRGAID